MFYYLSALMTRFVSLFNAIPLADNATVGQSSGGFSAASPINSLPGPANSYGFDICDTHF